MKILITWILCLFYFNLLKSQTPKKDTGWYKCMTGKIDNSPATIYLHGAASAIAKTEQIIDGYYFLNKSGEPRRFYGRLLEGSKILLSAHLYQGSDNFRGLLIINNFKGVFTPAGSNKHLRFSFTELKDPAIIDFDYFYVDTIKDSGGNGKAGIEFEASGIWPKKTLNPAVGFYVREFIAEQLGEKDYQDGLLSILRLHKEHYLRPKKEKEVEATNINFQSVLVVYINKFVVSVANITSSNFGNVQQGEIVNYSVADLFHKKPLSLIDILGTEGVDKLPPLIQKYFRLKYNMGKPVTLKKAFIPGIDFQPSDNFYITNKGIGFSYLPGEIVPEHNEQVDVFVPFSELSQYLTPVIRILIK